jgi:polyphosphate kinase 2 (PPK2 family)
MLADEGSHVLKFFLHVSKDEQRVRLQERIDDPKKRWKFNARDLDERARWDEYMAAYAEAIAATSKPHAPRYVVPADRNWYRDLVVSEVLVATMQALGIRPPPSDPAIADLEVQ